MAEGENAVEFFGHMTPYTDNGDGTVTVRVADIPYVAPPPQCAACKDTGYRSIEPVIVGKRLHARFDTCPECRGSGIAPASPSGEQGADK